MNKAHKGNLTLLWSFSNDYIHPMTFIYICYDKIFTLKKFKKFTRWYRFWIEDSEKIKCDEYQHTPSKFLTGFTENVQPWETWLNEFWMQIIDVLNENHLLQFFLSKTHTHTHTRACAHLLSVLQNFSPFHPSHSYFSPARFSLCSIPVPFSGSNLV